MRPFVVCMSVIGSFALQAAAQSRGGAATGPAIRACSLLTKDLILKVTPMKDTSMLFVVPPQDDSLGATGSACDYGDVGLQIDPITPARFDELRKKAGEEWTPVAGVGDGAYFRNNRDNYAELFVRAGTHTLTIQMSVPFGSTAAAIKPNTIALANALVPKLR